MKLRRWGKTMKSKIVKRLLIVISASCVLFGCHLNTFAAVGGLTWKPQGGLAGNKLGESSDQSIQSSQNTDTSEESANVVQYKDESTIKIVQQALNDAGYDCGTPDGLAGNKTSAAIRQYQTDKGLSVDGLVTDELLQSLGGSENDTSDVIVGKWKIQAMIDQEEKDYNLKETTSYVEFQNDESFIIVLNIPEYDDYTIEGTWKNVSEDYPVDGCDEIYMLSYDAGAGINSSIGMISDEENLNKDNNLALIMEIGNSELHFFGAKEEKNIENNSTDSAVTSSAESSSKVSMPKAIDHYCEVSGCYKEGSKKVVGFNGNYEYYCPEHYQKMQDTISMMESDVGSGTASKHKCEECSKEGTHEITGLSGATEYYCTEHYNEMTDMLSTILGN